MILGFIKRIEDGVLAALLMGLIALAAYQVGARNFFDSGILWGDSLVRVLVLWITMVGAMVGVRRAEHIRIDLLPRLMRGIGEEWARRFSCLFAGCICALFAYYSYQFVRLEYEDGLLAFASVPAWTCEVIMPVGFAVMGVRYFVQVVVKP